MDLFVFAKTPFKRILRFHLMLGHPRFGNFLSIRHEEPSFLGSLVHISVYWNESEKYTEYPGGGYSRELIRNWKLWRIPSLIAKLREWQWKKNFAEQARGYFKAKDEEGLGALFG